MPCTPIPLVRRAPTIPPEPTCVPQGIRRRPWSSAADALAVATITTAADVGRASGPPHPPGRRRLRLADAWRHPRPPGRGGCRGHPPPGSPAPAM